MRFKCVLKSVLICVLKCVLHCVLKSVLICVLKYVFRCVLKCVFRSPCSGRSSPLYGSTLLLRSAHKTRWKNDIRDVCSTGTKQSKTRWNHWLWDARVSEYGLWNLTDMTLADEDTKSILTENANRAIQGKWECNWLDLVDIFVTNASDAIWWPNLQPMQVVPSGGQIWN